MVELTGWDYYTLIAQPQSFLDELIHYQSVKHAVQEEKRKMDERKK